MLCPAGRARCARGGHFVTCIGLRVVLALGVTELVREPDHAPTKYLLSAQGDFDLFLLSLCRGGFVGEVAGAVHIPACDRAPGLPASGAFADDVGFGQKRGGDLLCWLEALEGEGEAFADAVVIDGQHVGSTEAEDEHHLDGPLTDAADLGEMLDDGVVRHAADAGEGRDGTVERLGSEIADGEGLGVREAGDAKLLVRRVEELLRVGMGETERKIEGREAFDETLMDGGGGFAVELLIDDGLEQGLEGRLAAGELHGEWAGALDEFAELRICGGEVGDGLCGVVAWGAWRLTKMRHGSATVYTASIV